jgi:hypothetical protein
MATVDGRHAPPRRISTIRRCPNPRALPHINPSTGAALPCAAARGEFLPAHLKKRGVGGRRRGGEERPPEEWLPERAEDFRAAHLRDIRRCAPVQVSGAPLGISSCCCRKPEEAGGTPTTTPSESPAPPPRSYSRAPRLHRRAAVVVVRFALNLFDKSLLQHCRHRDSSLLPCCTGDALATNPMEDDGYCGEPGGPSRPCREPLLPLQLLLPLL